MRIWKDKWLPQPTTYIVQSPTNILDANECIVALIDSESKIGMFHFLNVFFPGIMLRLSEEFTLTFQTVQKKLFGDALSLVSFLSKVHIIFKKIS